MSFYNFLVQKDLTEVLAGEVSGFIKISKEGQYSRLKEVPTDQEILDFSDLETTYLQNVTSFLEENILLGINFQRFFIYSNQLDGSLTLVLEQIEDSNKPRHIQKQLFANSKYGYALHFCEDVISFDGFFEENGYPEEDLYMPVSKTITGVHQMAFNILKEVQPLIKKLGKSQTFFAAVQDSNGSDNLNDYFFTRLSIEKEHYDLLFPEFEKKEKIVQEELSKLTNLSSKATISRLLSLATGLGASEADDIVFDHNRYAVAEHILKYQANPKEDFLEATYLSDIHSSSKSLLIEFIYLLELKGGWFPVAFVCDNFLFEGDIVKIGKFIVNDKDNQTFYCDMEYNVDYALDTGEVLYFYLWGE